MQCSIEWTFTTKFLTIALMPVAAVLCSCITAVIIKLKNFVLQEWQLSRNVPLSEPTDIQALWGLLLAANYYLYLQARSFVFGYHAAMQLILIVLMYVLCRWLRMRWNH